MLTTKSQWANGKQELLYGHKTTNSHIKKSINKIFVKKGHISLNQVYVEVIKPSVSTTSPWEAWAMIHGPFLPCSL